MTPDEDESVTARTLRLMREEWTAPLRAALEAAQDEIERLTGERDRARDLAVRSGVFTNPGGPMFSYALTAEDLEADGVS